MGERSCVLCCFAGAPFSCSIKVPDEEFDELSNQEDFAPAPYMARAKWVLATGLSKSNKKEWEEHIKRSHELIKEKPGI